NFLYYIASGRYKVIFNNKVVGSLSPADMFMGEMAFLLNNKRSAAVYAEEQGKLIKISRKAFVQVMKKYPHYGIFLSKLLARKIVRANEQHSINLS
ncbi:MAG: cyclic nucleotide-binding domain-containing protein, partial [Spirochaetales bacterium]|nr:cyclic nucleotide-binding domain-containing protein [Spirochaetales bacterium]